MPPRPSITCPACGATSHSRQDVLNAYCGACHAAHEDLPPWGFEPFEAFLLQRILDAGDDRTPPIETSSLPILAAFERLGLIDHHRKPTPAARAWGKTRRREPVLIVFQHNEWVPVLASAGSS